MKAFTKFFLLACIGCLVGVAIAHADSPASTKDEQPTPSAEKSAQVSEEPVENPVLIAVDVALSGKDGLLLGQAVDLNGAALADQAVRLVVNNRVMAHGKSDKRGYFAFRHLRGGVYQVASKDSFATVRAWADGTAPKSAKPKVLLVVGRETVRAQKTQENGKPGGRICRLLKRPVVVAGIVATAVAVPLLVNSSKKDSQGQESVTPVPEVVEAVGGIPASQ